MNEKLQKLIDLFQEKKYKKVVTVAFSADGAFAENSELSDAAMARVGRAFMNEESDPYRSAAEFLALEAVADKWAKV